MPKRADRDRRVEPPYSGDDPEKLAGEIEAALQQYGRGAPRRMLSVIEFFEGELALIAAALRLSATEWKRKQEWPKMPTGYRPQGR